MANLNKIKGEYDATFSLGHLCLAAMKLREHNLRPFSGVLDWVGSPTLSKVNLLLKNRFSGFMDIKNLKPIKYLSENDLYVYNPVYDIGINHDFKAHNNTLTHLGGYPEVREKYDRRIKRFLDKVKKSKRILFIRTEQSEASLDEIKELESILSEMVVNDFELLMVHHKNVNTMIDKESPLEKVTIVELPNKEIWKGNDIHWSHIFDGIKLV